MDYGLSKSELLIEANIVNFNAQKQLIHNQQHVVTL
nr:hypothetical protein [Ningiella sp. W23]